MKQILTLGWFSDVKHRNNKAEGCCCKGVKGGGRGSYYEDRKQFIQDF